MAQPPTASYLKKILLSNFFVSVMPTLRKHRIIEITMKLFSRMKMTEISVWLVNNQLFLKTT